MPILKELFDVLLNEIELFVDLQSRKNYRRLINCISTSRDIVILVENYNGKIVEFSL